MSDTLSVTTSKPSMTIDEAIRALRADPTQVDLVRDAYLGRDVEDSARRFAASDEWTATQALLAPWLEHAIVLDLGSGVGISAAAFASAGAQRVYAVEPDPSDEVGRGAMARLGLDSRVIPVDASGEGLPLDSGSVDIVYTRQVLHHIRDLKALMTECARVLRPGGAFLAVREHVVDDAAQLAAFLESHPVHRLAGGENAHALVNYTSAITDAGLSMLSVLDPWDSIINAFPAVRTADELRAYARSRLAARLGRAGSWLARLPGVERLAWRRIRRPVPGRLYAFLAEKPPDGAQA
jgi:SAM-dependent methyltransferase